MRVADPSRWSVAACALFLLLALLATGRFFLTPPPLGSALLMQPEMILAELRRSPVRSGLWTDLARSYYQDSGVTAEALHALGRALLFAPNGYAPLLLNAEMIFYSGGQMPQERQLRGWELVMDAAELPGLEAQVVACPRCWSPPAAAGVAAGALAQAGSFAPAAGCGLV